MEEILSPGSKGILGGTILMLAVSFVLLTGSINQKNIAEYKLWEKSREAYVLELKDRNNVVIYGEKKDETC